MVRYGPARLLRAQPVPGAPAPPNRSIPGTGGRRRTSTPPTPRHGHARGGEGGEGAPQPLWGRGGGTPTHGHAWGDPGPRRGSADPARPHGDWGHTGNRTRSEHPRGSGARPGAARGALSRCRQRARPQNKGGGGAGLPLSPRGRPRPAAPRSNAPRGGRDPPSPAGAGSGSEPVPAVPVTGSDRCADKGRGRAGEARTEAPGAPPHGRSGPHGGARQSVTAKSLYSVPRGRAAPPHPRHPAGSGRDASVCPSVCLSIRLSVPVPTRSTAPPPAASAGAPGSGRRR